MPVATANQTIGPYWHLIEDPTWADLTRFGAVGEKIALTGTIRDGAGDLVTDATGSFRFVTLRPGPVAGLGNAQQAPHVAVSIFTRGLLKTLTTRLYFQDEPLNETDPVLSLIETPARRNTLIARKVSSDTWHLDIRLQGGNETVFMEI
jgi:protocatechuate 3,4-dioxygenase alpha subunit